MLGYQKRKIGILRLKFRSIKAVAIDCHDSISILAYHITVRIHAEGSYLVLKFLRAVNDLALIQL